MGEGQNEKLYGSGPDPFPPPRNKKGKGRLRETSKFLPCSGTLYQIILTRRMQSIEGRAWAARVIWI